MERPDAVTFAGKKLAVEGRELKPGDAAPDFRLLAVDLSEKSLKDWDGKTRIVSVVPSLDTRVCDKQTRRFNELATANPGAVVLTVSMDLPFAQKRWCGAAGVDRVVTLSDHRSGDFGRAWGVLIPAIRLHQRAVFVVGGDEKIRHAEYVVETGSEPDYDAALAVAKT